MPRRSFYSSASSFPLSTPSLTSGASAISSPTRPVTRQTSTFPIPGVRHVGPGREQDRLRQQFRSHGRRGGRQPSRRVPPRGRPARNISDEGDFEAGTDSDDSEAAEFRRGRGRWRGMTGGTGMWDSSGRPMGRAGGAGRQRGGMNESGRRGRGVGGRRGGRGRVTGGGRSTGHDFDGPSMGMGSFRAARRGLRMRAAPLQSVRARNGGGGWSSGFAGRGRGRGGRAGAGRMAFPGSHGLSSSSEWSDCSSPSYASSGEGRLGSWGKAWTPPESRPRHVQEAYYSPYVVGSRRAKGRGGYAYDFAERRPRVGRFAIEEEDSWLGSLWSDWFGGGRSAAIMPWTRWWG